MQLWQRKNSLLRGERFTVELAPIERELLGGSAVMITEKLMERVRSAPKDELAELTGMHSGHAQAPRDPGLARLLPSFFHDGDEVIEGDAELTRQLTETDIIRGKLLNLQVIVDYLGPDGSVRVSLDRDEVASWLAGITDIRLYHFSELQVMIARDGEDQPHVRNAQQYLDFLGAHQDSLLTVLMGEARDE